MRISIQRGAVILAPFPHVQNAGQSSTRPLVVIQNNEGNQKGDNLIVALISSQIYYPFLPTHYFVAARSFIGNAAGLSVDSVIKTETIMTIPKNTVQRIVGHFPADAMTAIDGCLKVSLAL